MITEPIRGKDERGRFLPGNQYSKGQEGPNYTKHLTRAIQARFPVEDVAEKIAQAWDKAVSQNSSRGMVAVLGMIMDYGAGKPVQRLKVEDDSVPTWIQDALTRRIATDNTQLSEAVSHENGQVIDGESRVVEEGTPGAEEEEAEDKATE